MTRAGRAALMLGRLVALAALAWAIAVSVTGGFVITVAGIRVSSHRIVPPYALAMIILFGSRSNRVAVASLARRVAWQRLRPFAPYAAPAAALLAGLVFGAFTAAGDAFGYLSQSAQWFGRCLFLPPGPAAAFSWPSAVWAFTPLGYRPALGGAALAPTYPPGFPLIMAAARLVAGSGAEFLVVPISGALCVYLTYRLGRLCYDRVVGVLASILTLASPVFLFQLVQPMSDVPATAAWLLSVVALCEGGAIGAAGAGLAASLAILIRPNLAPLVLPLGAYALLVPAHAPMATRFKHAALFAAGLLPLCAVAGWVNAVLWGSPLSSGYGRAADLYSLSHFRPNLARYPRWLIDTQTVFILLAVGAPLLRRAVSFCWLALAFALALFFCYAFYLPFDHWSFLRFLLPGIPLLLVLAAGVLVAVASLARRLAAPAVVSVAVLVLLLGVQFAARGDVFRLKAIERERFQDVGRALNERAEKNAVYLALVHTGTLRYYAHRDGIRFDVLPPDGLDAAVTDLRSSGYVPYVLLAANELAQFRARFSSHSPAGRLDWTPTVLDRDGQVLLFDLRDRGLAPVRSSRPMPQ